MAPSIIALTIFIAVAAAVATVLLLVRDVAVAITSGRSAAFRLQRLPTAPDDEPQGGLLGRFDHWLLHLSFDAGYAWSGLTIFLFLTLVGLLVGGALFVGTEAPLAGLAGFVIGVALAIALLVVHRNRRIKQLQDQLPPALDMLARAVRAGESLDQAVHLVGDKSPEPLAVEFRRAARQLEMGLSMTAVMRALVRRVRLVDVRIFTTTLTVHRQTGGNLAWTLERLAVVIRDRLAYRRQMRVATSAGRWSAGLIAIVGPLLFAYLFFMEPQYVEGLLSDPIGQVLLMVAVFLEVVGLIWIYRMLRTD